ncbi:MAG: glycosyltransferase family 4 protein, partial [Chthoniobacterales bacterium]
PFLGRLQFAGGFVAKWLAYLDKFFLFRRQLARRLSEGPDVVHICDHSNAMLARWIEGAPVVVTCHDLLAVRGALGEQTDCPATATGKILQRWIVRGLEGSDAVACVSEATLEDAQRLVKVSRGKPRLQHILLGLSYPYQVLPIAEARARLAQRSAFPESIPFVLHVGSNLRRKNREGVLRIFARCRDQWNGLLVFAGDPLDASLNSLGRELGIAERIVEIPGPDNKLLEALYNCATALLFPSTFEGFGWPIAEAHACGCPVLCADRSPMKEVAGDAGLTYALEDEQSFANGLLELTKPDVRVQSSARAVENARRFSTDRMISEYVNLYRSLTSSL